MGGCAAITTGKLVCTQITMQKVLRNINGVRQNKPSCQKDNKQCCSGNINGWGSFGLILYTSSYHINNVITFCDPVPSCITGYVPSCSILDGKELCRKNVSAACSNHILTNHICKQQLLPIQILHTFISPIWSKFKASNRKKTHKHNPQNITYQHMPHRYLQRCGQVGMCQPENTSHRT
jgi:hypothetical protein